MRCSLWKHKHWPSTNKRSANQKGAKGFKQGQTSWMSPVRPELFPHKTTLRSRNSLAEITVYFLSDFKNELMSWRGKTCTAAETGSAHTCKRRSLVSSSEGNNLPQCSQTTSPWLSTQVNLWGSENPYGVCVHWVWGRAVYPRLIRVHIKRKGRVPPVD